MLSEFLNVLLFHKGLFLCHSRTERKNTNKKKDNKKPLLVMCSTKQVIV